jgi:hypothetical protein
MFKVKFRPSSHSTDLTLIATYGSADEAAASEKVLLAFAAKLEKAGANPYDWLPDNIEVHHRGKQLRFAAETNGQLNEIEDELRSHGSPKTIQRFEYLQDLTITATFPSTQLLENVSVEILILVFGGAQARLIKGLQEECGTPKKRANKNKLTLTWTYSGNYAYNEDENQLFGVSLRGLENWAVERL